MKLLLVSILALPLLAVNYRSFDAGSGKYGNVTTPNTSPWNLRTDIRFEGRLHNWTSTGRILQWDGFVFNKNANDISAANFFEAGSPSVSASTTTLGSDVLFRIQRSSIMWSIELWKSDGSLYIGGQFVATNAANFSLGGDVLALMNDGAGTSQLPAQLAWFRVYSTTVTRGSAMPTNQIGGDLLDYEFEGNGNNTSANPSMNLTVAGGPSYPSTPVVPMVGPEVSIKAGGTFNPNCSGTDADSYYWRYQGNQPLSVSIANKTTATPTFSGINNFGQFSVSCTATINGVEGTSTLTVGAVGTNSSEVVIPSNSTLSLLLSPMLRSDVSAWTWYDRQRRDMGTYWYNYTAGYTNNFTSTEAENYYDSCLVQYQNYYRTGMTRYLTYARACADKWYSQYWSARATAGTCGASGWMSPRNASIHGLVIRAVELNEASGGLMWTCLTAYANNILTEWVESRTYPTYTSLYFGPREIAYAIMSAIAIAVANPDAGIRTSYSARVVSVISNPILALQCNQASILRQCTDVYTTGAGTIAYNNGSTSVVGTGSNFLSLFAPSGDTIIVQENGGGYYNYWLTVASRASDTSLTLGSAYTGTNTTGFQYAKVTTTSGALNGSWREIEENASVAGIAIGYGELLWHTGLLVEAMYRAYLAGIETTNTTTIAAAYGSYLLAKQSTYYPTQTCTGSFNNIQARRTLYSVWFATGPQGSGCSSDQDVLDQRQHNSLVLTSVAFGYRTSGNSSLVTLGDEMWASTYGNYNGPNTDGGSGLLASTTGGAVDGKFYGQSARNGSYLVERLGTSATDVTPSYTSVTMYYSVLGITGATKARFTVTLPNGSTTVTTCTSSPCTITGLDTRQGNVGNVVIEKLSVADVVLATSQSQPLIY